MRVAHGRVGDEELALFADEGAEFFGAHFQQFLAQSRRWGDGFVVGRQGRDGELALGVEFGFDFWATVDADMSEITKNLGGAVALGPESAKSWGVAAERL